MSEPTDVPTSAPCPPRCRAAAHATWSERLARFPLSGLTPAQFCAQEGVSLPSFYAWRRRLTAPGASAEQDSGGDPGPRLLPVRLPDRVPAVELVLPTGAVLRVGAGADEATLRSLLHLLGVLPC